MQAVNRAICTCKEKAEEGKWKNYTNFMLGVCVFCLFQQEIIPREDEHNEYFN